MKPKRTIKLGLERLEDRLAPANDLFAVAAAAGDAPGAAVQLRFEWGATEAAFQNEVGVYVIDDTSGRVGGLLPPDAGYAAAALSRAQVVFATGTGAGAKQTLSFQPGQLLGLYVIADGSTAQGRAGERDVFFTFDDANPDQFDHVIAHNRGDGGRDFRFEDLLGGGDRDFDDAVIGITRTQGIVPPGQLGQTVVANFTKLPSTAAFKNEVGIVRTDGPNGRIGNQLPGDPGYLRAALGDLSRRQTIFSDLTPEVVNRSITLNSGEHYTFYLVADGTTDQILATNPNNEASTEVVMAYFSFSDANPDRLEHLAWRNGNEVGFEDLFAFGDADFDDSVIRFSFDTPTGTPINPPTPPTPPDTTAPTANIVLLNDNGSSSSDNITNDPALTIDLTDASSLARVRAGFDSGAASTFTNLLPLLDSANSLDLDASLIRQINRGADLSQGMHTLFLDVADSVGNSDLLQFTFTIDTLSPNAPTFNLDDASDTGANGDLRTGAGMGALVGSTEAGARVDLIFIPRPDQPGTTILTTAAAGDGSYRFDGLTFAIGSNDYRVMVTDTAGNSNTASLSFVRSLVPTVQPENDIANQTVSAAASNFTFDLRSVFDTVARFNTSEGNIDILLFENSRPITVNNFLDRYVNNTTAAGNYNDSIFHRLDKDFVLQGGGFKFDPAGTTTASKFPPIVDGPMITNEPGIPNTRGTIAMAKLSDPNSATNEFFFNLEDNPGLDNPGNSGGFTVFGRVTAAGQQVIDSIEAGFNEFNGPGLPGAAPFPVRPGTNTTNFPANVPATSLARIFRALTLADARSYTFTAVSSNTAAATVSVTGATLTVDPMAAGMTTITVTATDPDESTFSIAFEVNVTP